jgi:hypothetical protein
VICICESKEFRLPELSLPDATYNVSVADSFSSAMTDPQLPDTHGYNDTTPDRVPNPVNRS